MVMIDPYVIGGIVAVLFGFVLLYKLQRKMKKARDFMVVHSRRSDDKVMKKRNSTVGNGDSDSDVDVVIVGAGVAGAALAYALGKDGRRVHIIERDLTGPDRIAGEFLLPGGYLKLLELGLEDCFSDIDAQRVSGYIFHKDDKELIIPYPIDNFQLDASARSFHNGLFVQSLRRKATTLPNVRMEEGTVTSLLSKKGTIEGVQYKTKDGEDRASFAPLTIVCDGGFSNLRRSFSTPQVETPSCFVGLILEHCQLPYENYGHFIVGDPALILIYPISSTEIRCLVDIPGEKVPSIAKGEMANYLKTMVAPEIPPQLHNAFIAAIEKGNIRTMPNRSMPASPHPTPGAFLMGDAFNMRHPLTGGGMTVALSDVVILRNLLKSVPDLTDTQTLCKYLDSFYTLRKPVASTINILADSLHKGLCYSPDPAMKEMRNAIFNYFALGGMFSRGLMFLLSGLKAQPLSLLLQFFAISVYGVIKILLPFPSPQRVWLGARLLWGACGIMIPILRAEGLKEIFIPTELLL